MRKSYPPTGIELAAFGLPLEIEMMSLRTLNFGYLNPILLYDVDNNLIVMF